LASDQGGSVFYPFFRVISSHQIPNERNMSCLGESIA
jgi:hypothetical protein